MNYHDKDFPLDWTFGYRYDRDADLYEIYDIETGGFDHYEPTEYDAIEYCDNYTHGDDYDNDPIEYIDYDNGTMAIDKKTRQMISWEGSRTRIKESMESPYNIAKIADEIVRKFDDEVNVDLYNYDVKNNTISFEINGDWKHSHLYFDSLMKENYPEFELVNKYELNDTGEDWYDGVHVYKLSKHADDLRKLHNISKGLTEKLMDVPQDVIRYTKALATSFDLKLVKEGKLLFGGYHMEFAPIAETSLADMVRFAKKASKHADQLGCPTTFNVTNLLAVIDIREQNVDDNGTPIPFNTDDYDDSLLEKKRKRKKSLGAWLIPNAGNVEYNVAFFNHMMGADKETSTDNGATATDGATSDGGNATAMAEAFNNKEFKTLLSKKPTEMFHDVEVPFTVQAVLQGADKYFDVDATSEVTEKLPADVEICPSDEDWIKLFTDGLEIDKDELTSMSDSQISELINKEKSYIHSYLHDIVWDALGNVGNINPYEGLETDPFGDGTYLSINITKDSINELNRIIQNEQENIRGNLSSRRLRSFRVDEHLNRARNRNSRVYQRRNTFESVDKSDFKLGAFAQWFAPFDKDLIPKDELTDYNRQQSDIEEIIKGNYGSFTQYLGCAIAKQEFYDKLKDAGYNILDFIDSPKGILAIKIIDNKCIDVKVDSIINAINEEER